MEKPVRQGGSVSTATNEGRVSKTAPGPAWAPLTAHLRHVPVHGQGRVGCSPAGPDGCAVFSAHRLCSPSEPFGCVRRAIRSFLWDIGEVVFMKGGVTWSGTLGGGTMEPLPSLSTSRRL